MNTSKVSQTLSHVLVIIIDYKESIFWESMILAVNIIDWYKTGLHWDNTNPELLKKTTKSVWILNVKQYDQPLTFLARDDQDQPRQAQWERSLEVHIW